MNKKVEIAKAVGRLIKMNVKDLDDQTAAKVAILTLEWKEGKLYKGNDRVSVIEDDTVLLYKCLQSHTSDQTNKPSINTAALWTLIDVEHDGTFEDPIPYCGNMTLENGKYYIQYEVVYECIEDTVNAVFADLKDLPRYCKSAS